MDDYKKRQQEKFLREKKIKIEEEEQITKEVEAKEKAKQEAIEKARQEEAKKEYYVQGQLLIIDDSIKSFSTDKTDDNILFILTCIKASIENIQTHMTDAYKKIIIEQLVKFTNEVDKINDARPKGIQTIQNVKMLKDCFQVVYDLVDMKVEIQTMNTEKDKQIAEDLHKKINKQKAPVPVQAPVPVAHPVARLAVMPAVHLPVQPVLPPVRAGFGGHGHGHGHAHAPFAGAGHGGIHSDSEEDDVDMDRDDDHEDDEVVARRLQEEWNKPKPKTEPHKKTSYGESKYSNLNCEDFIKALMMEQVK
jgi:hypothetical protein